MSDEPVPTPFHPGHRVDVRTHFDGSWARGFEVADTVIDRRGERFYRLRRLSDGVVLPVDFPSTEVRPDDD